MPGDWESGWPSRFPPSKPIPADGLVSSKQRGPMAESWWSRRFIDVLESYGLGGRMQRGRRYARTGQVLAIDVQTAVIAAAVQGSRPTPYVVTIGLPEPTESQWRAIDAAIAAKVGFAARLLAGEVPPDLEEVFRAAGIDLFPATWSAVRSACTCPDWGNPCKHIAAVLYLFADQLDADPWLLLAWRGRTRDQILAPLRGHASAAPTEEEVAPWWPFGPGPLPSLAPPSPVPPARPEQPDAVLDTLAPLDVAVGRTPVTELLRPMYAHLIAED